MLMYLKGFQVGIFCLAEIFRFLANLHDYGVSGSLRFLFWASFWLISQKIYLYSEVDDDGEDH